MYQGSRLDFNKIWEGSEVNNEKIFCKNHGIFIDNFNFYFIGPSDLHKLTKEEYDEIFPCHNVYSAWTNDLRKSQDFSKIIKYFNDNNITIDNSVK